MRLCYTSIGFGAHPHGQLIRGVFKGHDREKVEIVVFALSDDDSSLARQDIARHADHFVPLHAHHNPSTAMAQWGCDVALYLDGYLLGARPELFYRVADEDATEEAAAAAAAFGKGTAQASERSGTSAACGFRGVMRVLICLGLCLQRWLRCQARRISLLLRRQRRPGRHAWG